MVTVAVLSRQGRDSLCPDHAGRVAALADVSYHRLEEAPHPHEALALLDGVDILAATNKCLPQLDAELLDELPHLRGVVLYATGYDHVDVDLLQSRGVGLSVLPEYATNAVAEHAIGMLLALATRLHLANDRSRQLVGADTSLRGLELAGHTMGVVGVGRIGTRVAALGAALSMRVIGNDIDGIAVADARAAGIPMTSLDKLLATADAVMVCASHGFGDTALLGARELHQMRCGSLLVNVTRAALVDTAAAAAAVRAGAIRGYAVDDEVLCPALDGDLIAQGRVLQTGHSAWWRDEVLDRGRRMWGEHLIAAIEGRPLDGVTWPAPVDRVRYRVPAGEPA